MLHASSSFERPTLEVTTVIESLFAQVSFSCFFVSNSEGLQANSDGLQASRAGFRKEFVVLSGEPVALRRSLREHTVQRSLHTAPVGLQPWLWPGRVGSERTRGRQDGKGGRGRGAPSSILAPSSKARSP